MPDEAEFLASAYYVLATTTDPLVAKAARMAARAAERGFANAQHALEAVREHYGITAEILRGAADCDGEDLPLASWGMGSHTIPARKRGAG